MYVSNIWMFTKDLINLHGKIIKGAHFFNPSTKSEPEWKDEWDSMHIQTTRNIVKCVLFLNSGATRKRALYWLTPT